MAPPSQTPPAAIGFDLDHTLVIDNRLECVALQRLLEPLLEDGGRALGTLCEETARIDELLALQRAGVFSIDEAVRRFVVAHGVPADERYVRRFREMAVEMVGDFVIPLPGAKQTLGALRTRGFALAVLSNGWNPLQIHKAKRAGFDGPVLASAQIGTQKPDAGAFEAMLDVLGTSARQSWYVGDDPRGDVEGARSTGLRTIWMDGERKPYPSELPPPDCTIHMLEELLALFPEKAASS